MKKSRICLLALLIIFFIMVPQVSAKYILESSIVAVKIRIEENKN